MRSVRHDFDFHCHSTASDGSLSPSAMLEMAVEAGLKSWSLTDHDTVGGYRELLSHPAVDSLRLINGVELSAEWSGMTLHVLAFGFSLDNPVMTGFLAKQAERRRERALRIAEKAEKKLKLVDVYRRASEISGSDCPARPHFAQVLLQDGVVDSVQEAFAKHLGAGKWGDIKLFWPSLEELMAQAKGASAVTVIAHPFHYRLTATKLKRLIDEFKALGGRGVETGVPNVNSGQYGWISEELKKRDLFQSGGSDYHGRSTPWCRLGVFPTLCKGVPCIDEILL